MLPKPTAEPSVAKKTANPVENVSLLFFSAITYHSSLYLIKQFAVFLHIKEPFEDKKNRHVISL